MYKQGNLASLRMLVVHGGAFALAAVSDIHSEADEHNSSFSDACAFLLGTRAQLRLYSAPNASFRFQFFTRLCFLFAVTQTFHYQCLSKKRL
jgi:hypothetical protein